MTEVKYRQIADELRAAIKAGDLQPGDEAPTEAALAAEHGVHRWTARDALIALTHEGLLTPPAGRRARRVAKRELLAVHLSRTPGRVHPGESPTMGADSWVGDMLAAGREPEQHITVVGETASAEVAARLGIGPGDRVVSRRLVRYQNGLPHNLITFWFTGTAAYGTVLAAQESITEGSLAWLERNCGPVTHGPAEITSRTESPAEAAELRIPQGGTVMIVWRVSSGPGGPVVASMGVYPGDRTKLLTP